MGFLFFAYLLLRPTLFVIAMVQFFFLFSKKKEKGKERLPPVNQPIKYKDNSKTLPSQITYKSLQIFLSKSNRDNI
jgi:hypothetical protein